MNAGLRIAVALLLAILAWQLLSRQPGMDALSPDGSSGDSSGAPATAPPAAARYPAFLPPEAISTLQAIERGGPFPYDRDDSVFENREGRLPERPRGYYREYTVETPGSPDRGARRIVSGGEPPEVFFYTRDHYRSFRRVEVGS
jgi:guanyl-specific ribonuclease Sa